MFLLLQLRPHLFWVGLEALGGRFLSPFSIAFSGSSVDPLDFALLTASELAESKSFLGCRGEVDDCKCKRIKNRKRNVVVWLWPIILLFFWDRWKWEKAENGSYSWEWEKAEHLPWLSYSWARGLGRQKHVLFIKILKEGSIIVDIKADFQATRLSQIMSILTDHKLHTMLLHYH